MTIQQPVLANEFGEDKTDDRYLVRSPTGATLVDCLASIELTQTSLILEFASAFKRSVGLLEASTLTIPLKLSTTDLQHLAKSIKTVLAIHPVPLMKGLLSP